MTCYAPHYGAPCDCEKRLASVTTHTRTSTPEGPDFCNECSGAVGEWTPWPCPARTPKRIQRRRTKGWRMPEGAVYVGRPTEWGNPWRVGDRLMLQWPLDAGVQTYREVVITPDLAVALYRLAYTTDVDAEAAREQFAGKDLACWCLLDQPCHADVLLEMANG